MTSTSITNLAAPAQPGVLLHRRAWLWLAAFALLFVAYHHVFLLRTSLIAWGDANWSHAMVVPLISLLFIFQHRDRLAAAPWRHCAWGLPILFFGLFGYTYGIFPVQNHMAQGYSMIAALFGLVLWMLGPSAMRVLWFPIGYLGFAVKVSDRIWEQVAWQLQQLAADGATIVLKCFTVFINFDVEKTGTTIVLHLMRDGQWVRESLNIAEACSGLRMLMAFVALAVAMAFLWPRAWWQRAAMVLMAVPIAVGVNVLRVAALGLVTLVDPDLIHGAMHTWIGMSMLLPAGALFWLLGWVMDRMVIHEPSDDDERTPAHQSMTSQPAGLTTAREASPDADAPPSQRMRRALIGGALGLLAALVATGVYAGMLLTPAPSLNVPGVPMLWSAAAIELAWTLIPPAIVGGALGGALLYWRQRRAQPAAHRRRQPNLSAYGFVAAVLIAMTIGQGVLVAQTRLALFKKPVPLRHFLLNIPAKLGPWERRANEQLDKPLSAEVLQTLGTTKYLRREYRDMDWHESGPGGRAIVQVAYYTGTVDTVPHVPERCFLAGGAQGLETERITLALDDANNLINLRKPEHGADGHLATAHLDPEVYLPTDRIDATRFTFAPASNSDQKQIVMYFFIANGQFLPSPDRVRLNTLKATTEQYNYYCKVEVQIVGVSDPALARERAESLLTHLLPEIMACLPDWRAVERGDWPTPEAAARAERTGS